MRIFCIAALCAALGGCAGVSYAIDEYSGVEVKNIQMPDDNYRVFDKPAQNKMMVTPSLGAAFAQGAGQGLLLNAVDNTTPKPRFDAAALQYLENTGRQGCRIVDSYVVVKPQFEIKYDCAPRVAENKIDRNDPHPK
jgi:hypothetical protein